jgi:hypothetical protein
MNEQPEQKEPWQMTRAEYARQRKLRTAAREIVAEEKAGRRQAAGEMGFPQGHVYGLVEKLADLPPLKQSHRRVVQEALSNGLPVPPEVLADYHDLVRKAAGREGRRLDSGEARQAQADLLRLRRSLIESLWDDVREGCRRGQWSAETRQLAGQAAVLKAALRNGKEKSAGTLSRESFTAGRET